MRLINAQTLKLENFTGKSVLPPYAILSHTWGPAEDEVSYQNIRASKGRRKKGFKKIQSCCEQARKDGLGYAWVDTCCIDKTNNTELSEAINSMFHWYAEASVCYAYLFDVPAADGFDQLASSKWWTRGWTLQELLAPPQVEFFSHDWAPLGSRQRWENAIAGHFGIGEEALRGDVEAIRGFSIAQRMSWAASRVTTRKEDLAYCLLGIFDVNMPLLYGERDKAFIRLQDEIMRESDDQSIFSWRGQNGVVHSDPKGLDVRGGETSTTTGIEVRQDYDVMTLLAPSPSYFRHSHITAWPNYKQSTPFSMTNAGLRITGRLFKLDLLGRPLPPWLGDHVLFLNCITKWQDSRRVGIFLRQLVPGGDQFARANTHVCHHRGETWEGTTLKTIFIRKRVVRPSLDHIHETWKRVGFKLVPHFYSHVEWNITDAFPVEQFDTGTMIVHAGMLSQGSPLLSISQDWCVVVEISLRSSFCPEDIEKIILILGYEAHEDRPFANIWRVSGSVTAKSAWETTMQSIADMQQSPSRTVSLWRGEVAFVTLQNAEGKTLTGKLTELVGNNNSVTLHVRIGMP